MAAFVFNIAKGRVGRYADLPAANDAVTWLLLKSAGLESDATLQDYANIATLLAAANDEATFTGYARIAHVASIVPTVDNTANTLAVDDTTDPTWNPTSAQALGKIIAIYNPDTTAGANDSSCIPLFADDFAITTPTSGAITYQVASGGFYSAA